MTKNPESSQRDTFAARCRAAWQQTWNEVLEALRTNGLLQDVIEDEVLLKAIRSSLSSFDVTYHYALPTHLIAKYVDPKVDARVIQVQRGGRGAFDARTIAHQVIVPFDQQNYRVLGGSPQPYLNNPLRTPEFTLEPKVRNKKKDKAGWDNTYIVLNEVQTRNSPEFIAKVLQQVPIEIARMLSSVRVIYPTPKRISLERTKEILSTFLASSSGGDKPQAIATAIFRTIGKRFHLYKEVRRFRTTTADTASGQVADIECIGEDDSIMLAAEVKDTQLEINHINEKLPRIREHNVSELMYLVRNGIARYEQDAVENRIRSEFTSGHNIYVLDLLLFAGGILALVGEQGRREFLVELGLVLDEYGSPLATRREWANLLAQV